MSHSHTEVSKESSNSHLAIALAGVALGAGFILLGIGAMLYYDNRKLGEACNQDIPLE